MGRSSSIRRVEGTARRRQAPAVRDRLARLSLVAVLLGLLVGPAGAAEEPESRLPEEGFVMSLEVEFVEMTVAVFDRRGRCKRDLGPGDFILREKGRVQKIETFAIGEETPLDLVFLFDVSGSMGLARRLDESRWAAKLLLGWLRPGDRAALYQFADAGVEALTGFSDDPASLTSVLDGLYAYGRTALIDALAWLPAHVEFRRHASPAVLLFSDGLENASKDVLEEALDHASRANVPFFPIGFPALRFSDEANAPGNLEILRRIAAATGGRFAAVSGPADLYRAMRKIERDLRCSYRIGYYPTSSGPPGSFQKVDVRLRRHRGLEVRARRGYRR